MRSIMLCYNLKGTKKGRKIGMLGSFLGFRVKYVEKEFGGIVLPFSNVDNRYNEKIFEQLLKE